MKVRQVLSERIWAIVAIALLGPATLVEAAPITPGVYQLEDHPAGNISSTAGPYGFRADFLPPSGSGPTFSFELGGASMTLDWDGGTTALISGTLFQNTLGELWSLSFEITGVSAVAGPNGGFEATGGSGTLWENATMDSLTSYSLIGKQDSSGIAHRFLGDGHRLSGDSESEVGRGWVEKGGTNDFLYKASRLPDPSTAVVPEPASLVVWSLAGLVGMVGYRRRSRKNA